MGIDHRQLSDGPKISRRFRQPGQEWVGQTRWPLPCLLALSQEADYVNKHLIRETAKLLRPPLISPQRIGHWICNTPSSENQYLSLWISDSTLFNGYTQF